MHINFIAHHKSEGTGQVILLKFGTYDEIHQGHKKLATGPDFQLNGILKWWIDESFVVHLNMGGHNGGDISMGRVLPVFSLMKKKLNKKSSTETEVMGVDDCIYVVLWTIYW